MLMRSLPIRFWSVSLLALSLACSQTLVAQTKPNSSTSDLLTTDNKPKTDPKAKKKGILGSVAEKLDLSNNGNQVVNENGELNNASVPDLGLKIKRGKDARKKEVAEMNNEYRVIGNKFDNIPVLRQVVTTGAGDRESVEEFYTLTAYEDPSVYFKTYTWFDLRTERRSTSLIKDKEKARLLHGPYRRYVGDELVEEGFYYKGGKHGRWENYAKETDGDWGLRDKQKWYMGFPLESKITYYDAAKTKIKEVLPVMYGKTTGDYFTFFETGLLETEGRFDDSVKISRWREYHKFGSGGRLKKETQYGKDKYDDFEPFTIREYDNKGKLIYENKEKKKTEEEVEN